MENTLEVVIGDPVPLSSDRWVVGMSLNGSGVNDIASVEYKLVSDKDSLQRSSTNNGYKFYNDFEFSTDAIENCKIDVRVDLQNNKSKKKTIYLKRKQQIITIIPCRTDLTGKKEEIKIGRAPITKKDLKRGRKIKILFLAADPTNLSRLRLGEEFEEIKKQLRLAKQERRFNFVMPQLSTQPTDISQALLDEQPHIVHFSGHGSPNGALCFENKTGRSKSVRPRALAALFKQFENQIDCVLLNACYSETQAKAIAKHIKYVIGMKRPISDKAAIAFAVGFYQALGAGQWIEDAHKFGCVQIELQGLSGHLVPVLEKRPTQS